MLPIIREMQKSGLSSYRAIAGALNAGGIPTAGGGHWHGSTAHSAFSTHNDIRPKQCACCGLTEGAETPRLSRPNWGVLTMFLRAGSARQRPVHNGSAVSTAL